MKIEAVEESLADLQMRLTFQDDEVKNLNRAVERQRTEIDAVKAEVLRLTKLVAGLAPAPASAEQDETPPHY